MTPKLVAAYAKVMREHGVMALSVPGANLQLFPDAPELGMIQTAVAEVKEVNKGGCSMCGGTGRQHLMPGVCDSCTKKEAGVV